MQQDLRPLFVKGQGPAGVYSLLQRGEKTGSSSQTWNDANVLFTFSVLFIIPVQTLQWDHKLHVCVRIYCFSTSAKRENLSEDLSFHPYMHFQFSHKPLGWKRLRDGARGRAAAAICKLTGEAEAERRCSDWMRRLRVSVSRPGLGGNMGGTE